MPSKLVYKLLILSVVFSFALVVSAQSVQTDTSGEETLPDAGVTPASTLHVFDRFGDWVRLNVLTFNQIRKAEIRAEIAEERLAEFKAVVESGEGEAVVEQAENLVQTRADELQSDLTNLDSQGLDASSLIEKVNALSFKRQGVLEDVLDKAPERARKAITRAIENSRKGLSKAEEVLQKQVEKGLIDQKKAKDITEKAIERLKKQVEHRSEKLIALAEELGETPPEVKVLFEEKLKLLEDRLVNVESKKEFKEVRGELKENLKETASTILKLRSRHQLRDETSEEFLMDVENERFNPEQKAFKIIAEATGMVAMLKIRITAVESAGKIVGQNIKELLGNAEKHLEKATEAWKAKNFGEAFGQANAAYRNAKTAAKSLDSLFENDDEAVKKIEEVKTKIERLSVAIEEFKTKFGDIPVTVVRVLEEAKLQISKAEEALSQSNPRQAISHVKAAEKMIERAKSLLEGGKEAVQKRRELNKAQDDNKVEVEDKDEAKNKEEKSSILQKLRTSTGIGFQKPAESAKPAEIKPIEVVPVDGTSAIRPSAPSSVKVLVTDSGFEPREVKVQKGGSVVWVNQSGSAVWPASVMITPT